MTIIKKDGNVYVLQGPNPIVKEQTSWDPRELVFHNFSWEEITYLQDAARAKKNVQNKPKPTATEPEAPAAPARLAPEEKEEKPPTTPEPQENHDPEAPREFDLPYIKYKVLCYCLPANTKVHTDRLYGESWQKTTYGTKFIFPCVVIDSSDISLEFWTSDPKSKIGEKSIVYPFSYEVHNTATDRYDKVPYDEYRWWKISSKESKEGGWLFKCVPSETHPDFSD